MKFKLLYIPFFFISIIFVPVYLFLDWTLTIKAHTIELPSNFLDYWIPGLLSAVFIFIYLYPRTSLLRSLEANWKHPILFCFIAIATITISTSFGQEYMQSRMGKLIHLASASEVNNNEKAKYYSFDSSYVDFYKKGEYLHTYLTSGGSHSKTTYINYDLYVALPIFINQKDTMNPNAGVWLSFKYSYQIEKGYREENLEDKYSYFYDGSLASAQLNCVVPNTYYVRINENDPDYNFYLRSITSSPLLSLSRNNTLLIGIHSPFEERSGDTLKGIFISFIVGSLFFIFLLGIYELDDEKLKEFNAKRGY